MTTERECPVCGRTYTVGSFGDHVLNNEHRRALAERREERRIQAERDDPAFDYAAN